MKRIPKTIQELLESVDIWDGTTESAVAQGIRNALRAQGMIEP